MATKKKTAKKAPAKKAAKKAAKKSVAKRTISNGKREVEVRVVNERETFGDCCDKIVKRKPTKEELAYEEGRTNGAREERARHPMVGIAANISGVRNNLKNAMKELQRNEEALAFNQARNIELKSSIQSMETTLIELEADFVEASEQAME